MEANIGYYNDGGRRRNDVKRLIVLIVAVVVVALVSMTGLTVTPPFVSVWDLIDNRIGHISGADSIVVDTKLVVQATSTFDAPYKILVDADSALMSKAYIDAIVGGGTADSIGIDLDGDGTPESWLYSTGSRGIMTLSEGANITFTLTGDTLEIAGGAGGGSDTSLFLSEAVGSGADVVKWSGDSLLFYETGDTLLKLSILGDGSGDTTTFWSEMQFTHFYFTKEVLFGDIAEFLSTIELEGATDDGFQQVLNTVDPTADRQFTFPDDQVAPGDIIVGGATVFGGDLLYLALGNTEIIIGDGSNEPTAAALSGDVSMTNGGVVTVADDSHNHSTTGLWKFLDSTTIVHVNDSTGDTLMNITEAGDTTKLSSNDNTRFYFTSGTQFDTLFLDGDTLAADHLPSTFMKLKVHNATGATLTQGTPVFISGATGDVPNADSARADDSLQMPAVCILDEDIANGDDGFGIFSGDFHMYNTSGPGWSVGDPLYVAPTGGLTSTQPVAPNLIQKLGEVTRVNVSQGEIYVFGAGRSNDLPHFARFDLDMNGKDIIGADSADIAKYTDGSIDSLDLNQVQIGQWLIDTSDTRYETIANVAKIGDDTANFLLAFDSMQAWDNRGYADATTALKGIASFSSSNFAVTAGDVQIKAGGVVSNEIASNTIWVTNINYTDSLSGQLGAYLAGETWFTDSGNGGLIFEGATGGAGNGNELLLTVQDPASDIIVTIQNVTGTLALLANLADSIDIKVDSAGDGTNVVALHPIVFQEGTNITLTVDNDTLTIAGPAASGTADSMGVDTDGDGTVDDYLYSTVAGAFHIKKGSNITLTVDTDTLTIAGPAASGTADSTAIDTSGAGVYAFLYSTTGAAATYREGSAIDLTVDTDTGYIAVATNAIDTNHFATTNLANDEEIMTFEAGNSIEYHTPAELGLLTAQLWDSASTSDTVYYISKTNPADTLFRIHSAGGILGFSSEDFAAFTFLNDILMNSNDILGIDSAHIDKYADGSIDNPDLAADAVTSAKILTQTIVNDDIDTTSENFVFDGAYHITSAEGDSILITAANINDSLTNIIKIDSAGDGTNVIAVRPIIIQEGTGMDIDIHSNGDTVIFNSTGGGGNTFKLIADTGSGAQAALALSDTVTLQGTSTVRIGWDDQTVDTLSFAVVANSLDSTHITDGDLSIDDMNWRVEYMDLSIVHGYNPADSVHLTLPVFEGYTAILFVDSTNEASAKDTAIVSGTVPYEFTVDSLIVGYKVTGTDVLIDSLVLRGPDKSAFTNNLDSTYFSSGTDRTSTSFARLAIDMTDFTARAGDRFGLQFSNDLAADDGTVKVYYIQLVGKR